MLSIGKPLLGAVAASLFFVGAASAQTAPASPPPWSYDWPATKAPAANDLYKAYSPDPTHIPFMRMEDIPWTGPVGGEQQFLMVGDTKKPGPYILLLKWWPGNFSKPHFHGKARFITVLSGTWWVSTSTHFDPNKTYPFGPGTISTDVIGTIHWDGAKADAKEPVVLEIVGEGPVPNVNVDEEGKPLKKTNF
jgi:hypothetical protein